MRKPELTIPTILGILLAIGGLVAGVWLLRAPLFALVGASPEETPQEVKITNVADTSFVVSWITAKSTSGFVQYNTADKNPDLVVSDDRDQAAGEIGNYFTHFVTVRGLRPATSYTFRIGSGRTLYDQQGQLYRVTTGPALSSAPAADVAYGQVATANQEPAEGAIVYLSLPGIVPQATLVKASGAWVIPLSTARTSDLTSYAAYDKQSATLELFVQAGSLGTASAQATTAQDSPVADLVLGQNLVATTTTGVLPTLTPIGQATPLPTSAGTISTSTNSKFSSQALNPASEATSAGELVLLTPAAGERVNTTTPIITGTAPKNTKVTIEVNSTTQIVTQVRADAAGNFEYVVPQTLEPGSHTVTISALINGVVKKITKSFVVEAAGESVTPVKTATPSGQIKASPSPTPTPTPKATALPRVSIPSTASGVPTSGVLTPTLLLLILGGALVTMGVFSYKRLI